MENEKIDMNQLMEKARKIIEGQSRELLTQLEEEKLKDDGGVIFLAYKKAIEFLNNKELGGKNDEQEL